MSKKEYFLNKILNRKDNSKKLNQIKSDIRAREEISQKEYFIEKIFFRKYSSWK